MKLINQLPKNKPSEMNTKSKSSKINISQKLGTGVSKFLAAAVISAAGFSFGSAWASTPVYLDKTRPIEERVEDALSRMTRKEKVAMVHAQSRFSAAGVPRLGIPEIWCTDGPHGIRVETQWDAWKPAGWTNDSCTAFPALTCLAATWNPEMAALYGKSIGEEARYRKKDVLLGPGVNMLRTPLNGRNFEYMGEDPWLASRMVVPYVKGVQSNGVAACVKHFALNNQEMHRHAANVIVDDRTLYELYLPAFKAAVQEGGAWAIMGSYNLIGGQHGCHNKKLLKDILKGEWGFDGVVISDWGGTHNTRQAIDNGLDMEFGTWTNGLNQGYKNMFDSYHLAQPYLKLMASGEVDETELDDKVRRVLRLAFRTCMNPDKPYGSMISEEHSAAARKIAQQGIVLLKNDRNMLPVAPSGVKKILVVGENAIRKSTQGGGSSSLKAKYEVAPIEGIIAKYGSNAEVKYARGYAGYKADVLEGEVAGYPLKETRDSLTLAREAVDAARDADIVFYIGGLNKAPGQDSEDSDRKSMALPYGQDNLISEIAKVNNNLVVINISGTPVAMPWVAKVPAIVQGWYLGSECGNALADILSGDVNPSGRLPMTFPARLEDVGAHAMDAYPGKLRGNGSKLVDCNYAEGTLTGYRWNDSKKVKAMFPFGHGLSYTQFKVGKPCADGKTMGKDGKITITVPVTNVGQRAGAETVQLYISDLKSSLPRPVKELKDFKKVELKPGETRFVEFEITPDKLSYFDDRTHQWVAEPGEFNAHIATSSANIINSTKFTLK